MKYLKRWKPDLIASKDETRAAITECYVHEGTFPGIAPFSMNNEMGERPGTLVATNGRMMVAFAVILEAKDVAGYITPRVFRYARANCKAVANFISIKLMRKYATIQNGDILPRSELSAATNYPNAAIVIPKEDELKEGLRQFSPVFMFELASAMGYSQDVHAIFSCMAADHRSAAICRILQCEYSKQAIGVIMPQRCFEE